jgi:hypothetical protein
MRSSVLERARHTLRVTTYTRTPGGRYPSDGPFPGSEFRDSWLEPAFVKALEAGAILLVDLDGTAGYASSFLEEAFGGLARKHGISAVLGSLELKSTAEPYLIDDIISQYVPEAND